MRLADAHTFTNESRTYASADTNMHTDTGYSYASSTFILHQRMAQLRLHWHQH